MKLSWRRYTAAVLRHYQKSLLFRYGRKASGNIFQSSLFFCLMLMSSILPQQKDPYLLSLPAWLSDANALHSVRVKARIYHHFGHYHHLVFSMSSVCCVLPWRGLLFHSFVWFSVWFSRTLFWPNKVSIPLDLYHKYFLALWMTLVSFILPRERLWSYIFIWFPLLSLLTQAKVFILYLHLVVCPPWHL